MVHRIAIQDDGPLPPWSCGTLAMSTTLHLLLGNKLPHDMPAGCITRDHMLALHKALLHWLLTGSPPPLWRDGCLIDTISELPYTDS